MRSLLLTALLLLPQAASPRDVSDLYQVVFLRPYPDRKPLDPAVSKRIQSAHMAHIQAMAASGILIAAGPFADKPTTISGIFIFKANSLQQVMDAASKDPTVVERRNTIEAHTWRAPKGIGAEYARLHKERPETPENMGVHPLILFYPNPSSNHPAPERERIQAAQAEYLNHLRTQGKLSAAGPIEGATSLLSIVVFKRIPDAEAQRLIDESPAVKAGLINSEYHRWWCSEHVLPW